MSHTDIIIIGSTALFASTFGVYAVIRVINRHTRPPVNALNRETGDIELIDYIQPSQPQRIYNYPDLLESNYPIYERISEYGRVPSYWSGTPPSYWSGTPPSYQNGTAPSYQTVDRFNINSCLENSINLDLILWLILFFILVLLIRKLIISNKINIQFKVIRAMAIIVIIFIINSLIFNNSLYSISILVPFSLFEIDFRDSFDWKISSYRVNPKISYLKIQTLTEDIIKLLHSLNDEENYSMSLSFISSYKDWKDNKEKITPVFIDDAIIVNKESDPILITQFIMNRLNDKDYFISNWLFNDSSINSLDPVILIVTLPIIVKI